MKKSACLRWAIICSLPLFFAFTPTTPTAVTEAGIIVRAVPMDHLRAFKLRMANLQQQPVRIAIKDPQGRIIYSEKVLEHNGYRKLISLRGLPNGQYVLQIMHPEESRVGTLELKERSLNISWNKEDSEGYTQ